MTPENDIRIGAEFDHHSSEFRECPYATFDQMLSTCPISHSDHHGGFWSLVSYRTVFDAARDDDRFCSTPAVGIPGTPAAAPLLPIQTDPPLTKKMRDVTVKFFSPGAAEKRRPWVRRLANEMVNGFIERGECDIIAELATPLPAKWTLHMLGFDETKYPHWVNWVHTFVHDRTHDAEKTAAASMELMAEINKHLAERREAGDPGDDLFGAILRGHIDGVPFDDMQITMYTVMMMLGGMDTTSGLTGNALLDMIERPHLRQTLVDDPDLLVPATEEFLRHSTPTFGQSRTVTRDTAYHGQEFKAGEQILLLWAAANRDPEMFTDPDTIDFDRPNAKRHMSFGVGLHRCLGSHFARMMFQEMISVILERLPDYTLNGTPERFADAGDVYAFRHMPIRFTPGPRVELPEVDA